jgi:DNA-binding transcriptional regulator YdaS (Cro superfamily)
MNKCDQDADRRLSQQRRVAEVLLRRFANSQTAMAQQLGCTQAAISQVVTGRRPPGSRLLNSIANLPGVPADWIILGEGLLPEGQSCRDARRCFLPLYESLNAAFASDRESGVAPVGFSVSLNDYSESRLIFVIPETREWIDAKNRGLRSGDLLILETDRRLWATGTRALEKKWCVISPPSSDVARHAELVYVHHIERPLASTVASAYVKRLGTGTTPASQHIDSRRAIGICRALAASHGRNLRAIRLDPSASSPARSDSRLVRPRLRSRELEVVPVEDILAFAVALIRL